MLEPLIEIKQEDIEINKIFIKELEPVELNLDSMVELKIETVESEVSNEVLPEGFEQIELVDTVTANDVEQYFNQLSTSLNEFNDQKYMESKNVQKLIHKNFSVFKQVPKAGHIDLNLSERQKGRLMDFVYQFYLKYGSQRSKSKMEYVNFLIWNFELFKDDNPESLNKRMNASNRPKIRIV